jgi:prepilin-type N-terminal cleavage/methylation domain-containing protein
MMTPAKKTFVAQSGFTLIELLLYVSISAALLLATSLFLSVILSSRIKKQAMAEVDQQGMEAMHIITQTLRNADTISAPATSTSAAALSVKTITASTTPTVFDLASGTLRITEGTTTPVALTNTHVVVSGLTFSNLSGSSTPGTVRVQFTVSAVNNSGRSEFTYTGRFTGSATLHQP